LAFGGFAFAPFAVGGVTAGIFPTLLVLEGAMALRAAVVRVWGKFAVVQRCHSGA
jgi:hypothetical protein